MNVFLKYQKMMKIILRSKARIVVIVHLIKMKGVLVYPLRILIQVKISTKNKKQAI